MFGKLIINDTGLNILGNGAECKLLGEVKGFSSSYLKIKPVKCPFWIHQSPDKSLLVCNLSSFRSDSILLGKE